jgi:dihydroorotase
MNTQRLVMRKPDDWHVHLRDGEMLRAVLPFTSERFARAIVMPNLSPPVTSSTAALRYRERILAALPPGSTFRPLMTCYLTDSNDDDDIAHGFREGIFMAAKLYPLRATTNAQFGVSDITRISSTLEKMESLGMPLLIHGESNDPTIDIFDRERVFIETVLAPLIERHAGLKVVLEHITTEFAATFVTNSGTGRLAATITPHHLFFNRNAMFSGGFRPHAYCLPVAKRERDRLALRKAATSGQPYFFLGTDSAPHVREDKESACGCAGVFCAPSAIESYAQVFDEENALDRLEAFASLNGPAFYGLPPNEVELVLIREERPIESEVRVGSTSLICFRAREQASWRVNGGQQALPDSARSNRAVSLRQSHTTESSAMSAASPWNGDRPPHLPCRKGQLPAAVLFPGDPGRVDMFHRVLENFRIIGQNREYRMGVGEFDGIEIGVCSTGIGGPSTEIALVEATELGCKYALRVGGTGTLDPSVPLGSLLLVSEAIRGGGAAALYASSSRRALANPELLDSLRESLVQASQSYREVFVASVDGYYAGQGRAYPGSAGANKSVLDEYRSKGVVALDMEAESILLIGDRLGLSAGVLLAVHANRATDGWMANYEPAQENMIRVGCDALSRLVLKGSSR